MKKPGTVIAVWAATLLWVGSAQAARFETHATNSAVHEGTVYDTTTGLLWELKSPAGTDDVHDVANTYSWSISLTGNEGLANGTVFTSFLATLNGGDYYDPSLGLIVNSDPTSCFADHCDWRLPSIAELAGITDRRPDSIDPVFKPNEPFYWSASTLAGNPNNAWEMVFRAGGTETNQPKNFSFSARAVRSGL